MARKYPLTTLSCRYNFSSIPGFASFSSSSKSFSFNPAANDTGEWSIAFTVTNSKSSVYKSINFKVDVFNAVHFTQSPDDWRTKVMYLIMTDRFYDGDIYNNSANGEYAPADGSKIHGGDIQGLIDKINYIKNLGITAIWLTPVIKNYNSYHGYSAWNFKEVDPHFGNIDKLREFVKIAHNNGISVFLDIVCNHSADLIGNYSSNYSWNYPAGYSLKYNNPNITHLPEYFANLDFFHNYGNISDWNNSLQYIYGDFYGLDDFKTENSEVQKILSYIYTWWILKTDCDGFRVDTAKHVNIEFWEYFLPYVQSVCGKIGKNNFLIFGEVWSGDDEFVGKYTGNKNNSSKYLFNSVVYFPMYYTLLDVFKNQGATNLISQRRANSSNYHSASQDKLITFFDNHDLARFITASSGTTYYPHIKLAYLFMAAYPCIPCIYYGTEQGFDGGGDPWNREDMWDGQWDFGPSGGNNFNESHELYTYIKYVNEKLRSNEFIKTGAYRELYSSSSAGIFAFSRYNSDSEAIVIFNNSNQSKNAEIQTANHYADGTILTNIFNAAEHSTVASDKINISIGSMQYAIYKK